MSKSTFGYPNDPNFNLWGLDGPFLPHGPVMYPSGLNGAYGFPDGPLEPCPLPLPHAEKPMSPALSTIVAKTKPRIHGKKLSRSPAIRTSPHYRGLEMGKGQSGNNMDAQLSNALDAALKHLNGRGLETIRGGLPSVRETTDGHRPMKNKKRVSETTPTAGSSKKVKSKQRPRSPAKSSPEASVPTNEHDPTKSKWGGYGSFVARERARREDRERRQREQDAPKEVSSQGKKPDS